MFEKDNLCEKIVEKMPKTALIDSETICQNSSRVT